MKLAKSPRNIGKGTKHWQVKVDEYFGTKITLEDKFLDLDNLSNHMDFAKNSTFSLQYAII